MKTVLFRGLIIRNFEASMQGEHYERVHEPVSEIRPSRFEPADEPEIERKSQKRSCGRLNQEW